MLAFMQKIRFSLFYLSLCGLLSGCYSFTGNAGSTDLVSMINHLQYQFPAILQLVTAFAYLSGIALTVKGVYSLKIYGQGQTMMSHQHSLRIPLTYIMVGTALIFSPQLVNVGMMSLFATNNPLIYPSSGPYNLPIYTGILYMVQMIGFISFVRGWFKLSHPSQHGGGQSQFGSAMTHIIGGLCAINIGGVIDIMQNTLQ